MPSAPRNSTITGKVLATSRMRNSSYGNPRYQVVIQAPDGTVYLTSTSPNASFAYAIENREYQDQDHTYTTNPWGNITHAAKKGN